MARRNYGNTMDGNAYNIYSKEQDNIAQANRDRYAIEQDKINLERERFEFQKSEMARNYAALQEQVKQQSAMLNKLNSGAFRGSSQSRALGFLNDMYNAVGMQRDQYLQNNYDTHAVTAAMMNIASQCNGVVPINGIKTANSILGYDGNNKGIVGAAFAKDGSFVIEVQTRTPKGIVSTPIHLTQKQQLAYANAFPDALDSNFKSNLIMNLKNQNVSDRELMTLDRQELPGISQYRSRFEGASANARGRRSQSGEGINKEILSFLSQDTSMMNDEDKAMFSKTRNAVLKQIASQYGISDAPLPMGGDTIGRNVNTQPRQQGGDGIISKSSFLNGGNGVDKMQRFASQFKKPDIEMTGPDGRQWKSVMRNGQLGIVPISGEKTQQSEQAQVEQPQTRKATANLNDFFAKNMDVEKGTRVKAPDGKFYKKVNRWVDAEDQSLGYGEIRMSPSNPKEKIRRAKEFALSEKANVSDGTVLMFPDGVKRERQNRFVLDEDQTDYDELAKEEKRKLDEAHKVVSMSKRETSPTYDTMNTMYPEIYKTEEQHIADVEREKAEEREKVEERNAKDFMSGIERSEEETAREMIEEKEIVKESGLLDLFD